MTKSSDSPPETASPARRPTVCGVVLALDEAGNIERCLSSLEWCDDRVVLDSGSTDGTQNLAAAAGARVFEHRPEGPFRISDQRNWALGECAISSDWVLFLDADEVIPAPLRREILAALPAAEVDAYELCQRYMFLGRWMKRSQRFPQWHERLVRRGRARFEGGVWEHLEPGVRKGRLQEPYVHYANSKGFGDWLRRHDRYSDWEAAGASAFLRGGGIASFRTTRRAAARAVAARSWPLRPAGRFLYTYFVRGGFTEGVPGLLLALRYAVYEYMIVEKLLETRRLEQGEDL